MKLSFDDYDLETLVAPSVLVGLPPALLLALLGFNLNVLLGVAVLGIELAAFIFVPVNALIRRAGKSLENELFSDGMPTTIMLRSSPSQTKPEQDHRRAKAQALTGTKLSSHASSVKDPVRADRLIELTVNALKERMRDNKQFMVLRRELKAYGFWRNTFAIRNTGRGLAGLSLVCWSAYMFMAPHSTLNTLMLEVLCGGVIASILFFWIFINIDNVYKSANTYAEQFFKSTELL